MVLEARIYCSLNGKPVEVDILHEDSISSIADKFLLHGKEQQIPKLYNSEGFLVPVGKSIPPNSESTKYTLKFTAGIYIT